MIIHAEIIYIKPRIDESINYDSMIFKIDGGARLDMNNSKELFIFITSLINGGAVKILLNLKDLEFIDSSGIGVIISLVKAIRKKKGDLRIANIPTAIKDVFRIVNLQNFVKSFNTEGEAINSFHYIEKS